jgi:outer membrane murein-binding lipoprotein Lpp
MEMHLLLTLLAGLGGALLAGCATTSPAVDVVALSRQVEELRAEVDGWRADLAHLEAEVTQLQVSDGRVKTELPRLWAKLRVTNTRLDRVAGQLGTVAAQVQAQSWLSPEAGHGGPVLDFQRTPPPVATPLATTPHQTATLTGPRGLNTGMSPGEVRAQLGEPAYREETPDFVYWFYAAQQYVYFDRLTGKVQGWLGWP